MSGSDLLCNPFCNPEMLKDLQRVRILEMTPDVFMIEGYAGNFMLLEPPSANIFLLRDGDTVLLIDTGHHGFYRDKMMQVLNKFRKEGARHLVLVPSHGHWDHAKNNDIILEAGYETARFLLPEPEFHTMDIPDHMMGSFNQTREYYDPLVDTAPGMKMFVEWAKQFPEFNDPKYQNAWEKVAAMPDEYDPDVALGVMDAMFRYVLCGDLSSYIADRAECLTLDSRKTLKIGDVEFKGWTLGRFMIIHDASQSPGHVSIYDPKYKLMLTGDCTLEINPPFFDCDFGVGLEHCRKCLRLAEQGHITMASDAHRTSQFWPQSLAGWGMELLSPVQAMDWATGQDECITFYQFWVDYFTALEDAVHAAHARIGEATSAQIVEEFSKSDDKNVKFKFGLKLPNIPSSPELLVVKLMVEGGAKIRREGGKVFYSPLRA